MPDLEIIYERFPAVYCLAGESELWGVVYKHIIIANDYTQLTQNSGKKFAKECAMKHGEMFYWRKLLLKTF